MEFSRSRPRGQHQSPCHQRRSKPENGAFRCTLPLLRCSCYGLPKDDAINSLDAESGSCLSSALGETLSTRAASRVTRRATCGSSLHTGIVAASGPVTDCRWQPSQPSRAEGNAWCISFDLHAEHHGSHRRCRKPCAEMRARKTVRPRRKALTNSRKSLGASSFSEPFAASQTWDRKDGEICTDESATQAQALQSPQALHVVVWCLHSTGCVQPGWLLHYLSKAATIPKAPLNLPRSWLYRTAIVIGSCCNHCGSGRALDHPRLTLRHSNCIRAALLD